MRLREADKGTLFVFIINERASGELRASTDQLTYYILTTNLPPCYPNFSPHRGTFTIAPEMKNDIHSMDVDNEAGPSTLGAKTVDSSVARRPRASSLPLNPDNFAVGYIYSSEMMSHFSPHGHPEQPLRIQQIWHTIVRDQLNKRMKWIPIREVRKEEALLVHSEDHWDKVIAIQCEYAYIVVSTYLCGMKWLRRKI